MLSGGYEIAVRKSQTNLKLHFTLSGQSPIILYVAACEINIAVAGRNRKAAVTSHG